MNQQRSRRFKTAKEAEHKRMIEEEIKQKMRETGALKEEKKEDKVNYFVS